MAVSLFRYDEKKPPPDELPEELIECLIAMDTGWTLEYIRSLSKTDHSRISIISQVKHKISALEESEKKQVMLAALGVKNSI